MDLGDFASLLKGVAPTLSEMEVAHMFMELVDLEGRVDVGEWLQVLSLYEAGLGGRHAPLVTFSLFHSPLHARDHICIPPCMQMRTPTREHYCSLQQRVRIWQTHTHTRTRVVTCTSHVYSGFTFLPDEPTTAMDHITIDNQGRAEDLGVKHNVSQPPSL